MKGKKSKCYNLFIYDKLPQMTPYYKNIRKTGNKYKTTIP